MAARIDQPHSMQRSGKADRLAATGRTAAKVKDEKAVLIVDKPFKENVTQLEVRLLQGRAPEESVRLSSFPQIRFMSSVL